MLPKLYSNSFPGQPVFRFLRHGLLLLLLLGCGAWLPAQSDCDYDFLMGGTILPTNQITVCIDGVPDLVDLGLDWQMGTYQAWVVTDENGDILALPAGMPIDFDGAGAGVCLIWSVSHEEDFGGLAVGNNLFSDLTGCYELSENTVQVNRYETVGGQLSTADGATELLICADDGLSDAFDVTLTGNSGPASAWVITDDQLNILALPAAPPFDLEGAGDGICLVWHLSYVEGLYDLSVGANAGDFSGCFDLSNPITVTRLTGDDCDVLCNVAGGAIALPDGSTEISICAGDGVSDAFDVTLTGNVGENSAWVITDDALNILALPAAPPFDLEGAGDGTCLVWHLSFDNVAGAEVGMNAADLTGCFELSNAITVIRNGVDGGELMLADGSDEITICAGDGVSDAFDVSLTGNIGTNSAWVITDDALNILALPAAPPFDLEGAGDGTCLVWHLSFEDVAGAEVGMNAGDLTGCFDLSNPITVIRNGVDGGELMLDTGGDTIEICAGDGVSDAFDVSLTGNIGANSAWVITDDALNILALPAAPPFDLEGAGDGICLVWHLSFEDVAGVEVGVNAADLTGCFDLSNPITVIRNGVDGGELMLADGGDEITICAGDGVSDAFDVSLTGNSGANSAWVITDTALNILALPAAPPFDLEGAGDGTCLVWHLSFEDVAGAEVGMNAADLTGCFDLSNPITVIRNGVDGGELMLDDGGDTIEICAGDGVSDAFDVSLTGNIGANSAWVITDDALNILALPAAPPFDLEGAGDGTCLVWHLSFENVAGAEVGMNAGDLTGCFDLSNPITVIRNGVDGGELTLDGGGDTIEICAGDGVSDAFDVSLTGNSGANSAWVITDTALNILALPAAPPFDLEGAGDGTCLVWHLSFEDVAGAEVGLNAGDLTGCFDLSNPITVIRNGVDGGELMLDDGGDTIEICAGDGVSDAFDVSLTGNIGANSAWVITDDALNILALPAAPPFDLEGAGDGTCLVWHLSFEDVAGAEVGLNAGDLTGCFDLSNPITVIRNGVDGGEIALDDGSDTIEICAGDGVSDAFAVSLTGNIGANSAWVITDTALNILALPAAPPFDLEGAGDGTCLVWHLSFEDIAGAEVGMNAGDLTGCFDLSNPITVIRNGVDGGELMLADGGDEITICAGDGVSDAFDVTLTDNVGANSAWVITDDALNILALPGGPPFDLDGAGPGTCLVWHLSFTGNLTGAEVGLNAAELMGCFDLSNPITVFRDGVEGGELMLAGGGDELFICAGDGQSDAFDVTLEGNSGSNSAWVITDDELNILALPAAPPFDLEGAGEGICLVWHLSFNDVAGAEVGMNAADLTGCFDLSNPITVFRDGVDGGELALAGGGDTIEICAGDENSDAFDVTLTGTVGPNSAWVITDTALNILALPAAPPFDLEGAGPGTCLVWHLSFYDGLTGAEVGANAADLMGCFDLSNPITVIRTGVDGGELMLADGGDEIFICAGDGNSDAFDVTLTGNIGTNSAWVITDDDGMILALPAAPPFDLEGAGEGICLVWHLSFEDGLMGAEVGANALDLSGCFDLSNPITVFRDGVDGGEIALSGGTDSLEICANDGISDAFDVSLTGNIGPNSAWVITDDSLNILALPAGPPFDLEGAGAGTCLIWHLSFYDGLTGAEVGANAADLMGCFDLSNPVTVIRNAPAGGELTLSDGGDSLEICAGDGQSDAFDVTLEGAVGPNSAWVITDDSLNILALPAGPPFDLEGAGAGTCLIWHLSFAEGLTGAEVGANAADLMGCFDLSNPITVIRNFVDGGEISLADGSTETSVCAGDGLDDPIEVTLTGASDGNSIWVITDDSLNILALPAGPPFDFEGAGPGTCLIWHLTYLELTNLETVTNAADLEGCFDLSDPITVNRYDGTEPLDGGQLTLSGGGTELSICADDMESDSFDIELSGVVGDSSVWVIADFDTGEILALPAGPPFDLEGAGPGLCVIFHVSYTDVDGIFVGGNLDSVTGCFDPSNAIFVERLTGADCPGSICESEGGSLGFLTGSDSETLCTGETNLEVQTEGVNVNLPFYLVLTDTDDLVTEWHEVDPADKSPEITLAPTDPGTYRIYGWSTDGSTDLVVGMHIDTLSALGCNDPSDDYLELIRSEDVQCTTATADAAAATRFTLYPNPVRSVLTVGIEGLKADRSELQVWDTNGRLLLRHQVAPGTQRWELPTGKLAAGTYWLRLINRAGVSTRTFVKIE